MTIPKTGAELLRERMVDVPSQGMAQMLGMKITHVGEGEITLTAVPSRAFYNLMGVVHGGFAATLLDSACGLAAVAATRQPSRCLTLEIKVAYHAALTEATGTVTVIGKVLKIGRRTAFTEARLEDAAGKLYATATSTLLIEPES